jgi:hypothetical protein
LLISEQVIVFISAYVVSEIAHNRKETTMSNEPQISVYLDPPLAIGEHPGGNRQIVPIIGGSFEGHD